MEANTLEKRKKRPTISDVQNLVCVGRTSGGSIRVCLCLRACASVNVCLAVAGWLTSSVHADEHRLTLDLRMSSAQS